MDELRNEIAALIDQLEQSGRIGSAVDNQAIRHLKQLMAGDEKAFEVDFSDLKQFWIASVDWCSELSKQIEKLIIIHEDLLDREGQPFKDENEG